MNQPFFPVKDFIVVMASLLIKCNDIKSRFEFLQDFELYFISPFSIANHHGLIWIYPNPPPQAEYDTKSIVHRSTVGIRSSPSRLVTLLKIEKLVYLIIHP